MKNCRHVSFVSGARNGSGIDNNTGGGPMLPDISQLSSVNPEDMAGLWASYHSALGLNKGGLLKPSSTPPAPTHRENSVSIILPLMESILSSIFFR